MRITLQLALPLVTGLLVAAGFVLAALSVAATLQDVLSTVPGLTRERAVAAAVATLTLAGIATTGFAMALAYGMARWVTAPLAHLTRAAGRLGQPDPSPPGSAGPAEASDAARAVHRAGVELRTRHEGERRERDALASLVEAVSEGILRVGPDGRVQRLNAAARSFLGLPEDAVGRPLAGLLRNEELRELVRPDATDSGHAAAEVALDGRRVLVSAARQSDGGVVATFVDLTELRRLEEVRRDFVANASHELKTPLTSIRGYAETLATHDVPEAERREFLDTIARNAARLQQIVDDLLDLSRLEAGRWEPVLEPIAVLALAQRCWEPFVERAAEREVGFRTDGGADHRVLADRRALEHVFTNLFDNALRHTGAGGGIRVCVAASAPPETPDDPNTPDGPARGAGAGDGLWIRIDVVDTGVGIPTDALPRIFERFYRVDPARSRAEGGTGLGLAIVRHMVQVMGGTVAAESALGKGTTLRIWLPGAD